MGSRKIGTGRKDLKDCEGGESGTGEEGGEEEIKGGLVDAILRGHSGWGRVQFG